MSEPVKLKAVSVEAETNAGAVKMAEQSVEKLKSGEFTEVLIILFKPNGQYEIAASASVSELRRLGALEVAKWTILMSRYNGNQA